MCIAITSYLCYHRTEEHTPCSFFLRKLAQGQPHPRPQSFLRTFFCGSSGSQKVHCTQKPGKNFIYSLCPKCLERESSHRSRIDCTTRAHQEKLEAKARQVHNKRESERMQERRREKKKEAFRCSMCTAERRRPDQMSRAANSGLCCARGIEEFDDLERANGFRPSPSSRQTIAARPRPAPQPTREQRNPRLNYATSMEFAKAAGTVAAREYGWGKSERDSVMPEPSLAAAYVNSSGANPGLFAPAPAEAQPLYYEPGINFESWNQMQQTGHGRLPPQPEKPLPVPPLRTHKVARKEAGTNSNANSRRRREDTQVSPLSSPGGPWSPVSLMNTHRKTSRSDMSIFRAEVDDLAGGLLSRNSWEPLPEMPAQYRY
ncbi:hypothetical protein BDZ45DRAFT_42964 [Acephala macrosclerotiorum]|nr:hypothetical protein BDZ45DRAFT_42964 [Acephala macrosclerotiorum]